MAKITQKTTLADILKIKDGEKILAKHNVPCLGCAMAHMEMDKLRVGDICLAYSIDCGKLLKDLNIK